MSTNKPTASQFDPTWPAERIFSMNNGQLALLATYCRSVFPLIRSIHPSPNDEDTIDYELSLGGGSRGCILPDEWPSMSIADIPVRIEDEWREGEI